MLAEQNPPLRPVPAHATRRPSTRTTSRGFLLLGQQRARGTRRRRPRGPPTNARRARASAPVPPADPASTAWAWPRPVPLPPREPVHGQVLAVTGVLKTAVRHLRGERDMGVDPHRTEVQLPHHPHRPGVIPCPDTGGQPVLHSVGPAQRFVLGAEPLH